MYKVYRLIIQAGKRKREISLSTLLVKHVWEKATILNKGRAKFYVLTEVPVDLSLFSAIT